MWGRAKTRNDGKLATEASALRDALRQARIEAAERTGALLESRDAEIARLEILNDALDPVFAQIAPAIDLFDRGISRGDTPRLWIDLVAHIEMGRDRRAYHFVQDSRSGRQVLTTSEATADIAAAVTRYVARRIVERERALANDGLPLPAERHDGSAHLRPLAWFILGVLSGTAGTFLAASMMGLFGRAS